VPRKRYPDRSDFLPIPLALFIHAQSQQSSQVEESESVTVKHYREDATLLPGRARELRLELARKIASFIGAAENRATDVPGLALHRRTAPTAPCSMTYEPSVTVIAQGRKRVDLGRTAMLQ
jgi:hypothetical protein